MLKAGAEVNMKLKSVASSGGILRQNMNALMLAAMYQRLETVKLLLEHEII